MPSKNNHPKLPPLRLLPGTPPTARFFTAQLKPKVKHKHQNPAGYVKMGLLTHPQTPQKNGLDMWDDGLQTQS